jgi:hypothetical protein
MASPLDTTIFEVDFNDLDRDGRLLASMRFAHGAVRFPQPGEHVSAHDAEQNWCEGTVFSVDGLIVTITLDRDTWRQNYVDIENPFAGNSGDPDQTTFSESIELVGVVG